MHGAAGRLNIRRKSQVILDVAGALADIDLTLELAEENFRVLAENVH